MYLRLMLSIVLMLVCASSALAGPFAYVANNTDNTVSVIDTASNTVTAIIPVGEQPYGVAVNAAGSRVYVSNQTDKTISVIDTATDPPAIIDTIILPNKPGGLAVNPAGTRLYVANNDAMSLWVINTATDTIIPTSITLSNLPDGVAVNAAGDRIYVSNFGSNTVSVISANDTTNAYAKVTDIVVGSTSSSSPKGLAFVTTGAGPRVYVANYGDGNVSVINASTNAIVGSAITVGSYPFGVAATPDGLKVYVSNSGSSDNVSVISTASNTVTATVSVGSSPRGIAASPNTARVLVANSLANTASVINSSTNAVSATPAVGAYPNSLGNFVGPVQFPITITAGIGGDIFPQGLISVVNGVAMAAQGKDQGFDIVNDPNFTITSVTVDGVAQSPVSPYTFTNVVAPHTIDASFTRQTYTVNAYSQGGGLVSITSSPAGITCGPTCTNRFAVGTVVTFTAAPDASTIFQGWQGSNCIPQANPLQCQITLNGTYADVFGNYNVTALIAKKTTTTSGPVRIGRTTPISYFTDMQAAYTAAATGAVIDTQILSGALSMNLPKTVTLVGGWATDWSAVTGATTITGGLTISQGSLIVGDGTGGSLIVN